MSFEASAFAVGDRVYLETDGGGMVNPSIARGTITRDTKLYWIVVTSKGIEVKIRKDNLMKPGRSTWSPGTRMHRTDSLSIQHRVRLQGRRRRLQTMADLTGKLQRADEGTDEELELARQLQDLAINHHSDLVQSTRS